MSKAFLILILIFSTGYIFSQDNSINEGLIAHFAFDKDLKDSSERNSSLRKIGNPSINDKGLNFESSGSFLEFNEGLGLNFPWTYSCIIEKPEYKKIDDTYKDDKILFSSDYMNSKREANYCGFLIEIVNNKLSAHIGGGYKSMRSMWAKSKIPSDRPVLINVIFESKDIVKFFVDAKEIELATSDRNFKNVKILGKKDRIGFANDDQWKGSFVGKMKDLRIYNRALTDCEIQSIHAKNITPSDRVKEFTKSSIETWNVKDEYETTSEYENRIKKASQEKEKEFETIMLDSLTKGLDWNCSTKKYDADNEYFEIGNSLFEKFKIEIPKDKARQFGENFENLEVQNLKLKVTNTDKLVVSCIEIENPINNLNYKYGCSISKDESSINIIKVKSKTVTVKIWDEAREDGDIVSVFLNDTRIKKEITVSKTEYVFTLELNSGVNLFKLYAHNEGENSPNTAAILIDDGINEYKTSLSSKKDEFAELQIVLE